MTNGLKYQFQGFLSSPSLWLKKGVLDYTLFHTDIVLPGFSSEEIPMPVNSVLGKRMEEFFRYYIERFSEEQILALNEQIIENKITLGEIDFLLKNSQTSQVSHIELVYKFYLFDPHFSEKENSCWVGPNKRDFLVKKIDRLKQHQFPLLHTPAAGKFLKGINLSADDIEQKLCFKANLFLPLDQKKIPEEINPRAIQGFWLRKSQFTAKVFGDSGFFSPRKQDWPILPQNNLTWFSYQDILDQVEQLLEQKQSPLLWMKDRNGSFHRFFVVWW